MPSGRVQRVRRAGVAGVAGRADYGRRQAGHVEHLSGRCAGRHAARQQGKDQRHAAERGAVLFFRVVFVRHGDGGLHVPLPDEAAQPAKQPADARNVWRYVICQCNKIRFGLTKETLGVRLAGAVRVSGRPDGHDWQAQHGGVSCRRQAAPGEVVKAPERIERAVQRAYLACLMVDIRGPADRGESTAVEKHAACKSGRVQSFAAVEHGCVHRRHELRLWFLRRFPLRVRGQNKDRIVVRDGDRQHSLPEHLGACWPRRLLCSGSGVHLVTVAATIAIAREEREYRPVVKSHSCRSRWDRSAHRRATPARHPARANSPRSLARKCGRRGAFRRCRSP